MISLRMLLLIILFSTASSAQEINNFVPFTGWAVCRHNASEVIILRKFSMDNHCYYFTVSPNSLDTEVVLSDTLPVYPASWETIRTRYSQTPYIRALKQAEMFSDTLQDAGFTRFSRSQKGIDLTIDLCPSQRPLDRIVFTDLINEIGKAEKPVPVAISITGRWINNHPGDLYWLDSLVRSNKLSIVWVNHSYNHFFSKKIPMNKNFMLTNGTDIDNEVLNTEIVLLEKNLVPSIFFRFPGLVSDHEIYNKILNFGLIPVGSDAWLAKRQWPVNGSIVLIHANGNEPLGVRDFIELLKNKRPDVRSRHWVLYDLRESVVLDESR